MHSFKETRVMPYEASLINDIIMDIEKYPEFLPWCKKARIIEKNDDFLTAELFVEFKGFTESYVSKVITNSENNNYYIEVVAISGPFELLKNIWSIKQLDNGAKVDFSIDFAFSKELFNDKASLTFNVRDLLDQGGWKTETFNQTFYNDSEYRWRQRSYTLNFTYRFNQKKNQNRRQMRRGGYEDGSFDF